MSSPKHQAAGLVELCEQLKPFSTKRQEQTARQQDRKGRQTAPVHRPRGWGHIRFIPNHQRPCHSRSNQYRQLHQQ